MYIIFLFCWKKWIILKKRIRKLFFFSPGMSDQKLDEMIAKADVDNNGWVQFEVEKFNVLTKGT